MPKTAMFLHLGGPYDGVSLPVQVDDDGVPVESYFFNDIGGVDMSRNPTSEIMSDALTSLYERDEILDDDGFAYVFRFRGQDVIRDQAA